MANTVLVIGNGFDMDLGLKVGYADFSNSEEWTELVNGRQSVYKGNRLNESLVLYLEKLREKQDWFNIEKGIHDFVQFHSKPTFDTSNAFVESVMSDYEDLKSALCRYIKRETEIFVLDNNRKSKAYELLTRLYRATIISFNYTDCLKLCNISRNASKLSRIHGDLDTGIVLGCDICENDKVNRTLSFLYKYNMLNETNNIVDSLQNAVEIVFFGHSINEMDFCYFKGFFQKMSTSQAPYPKRNLTFITKDKNSMREIKDNIRNQGINVTEMYCCLGAFDFILTDQVYNRDTEDAKKWNELVKRIDGY